MCISWSHLRALYERDRLDNELSLVPKLRYEHIYLTGFSKMRVDLATQVANYYLHVEFLIIFFNFQVLSQSVSKALLLTNQPHLEETAKFVAIFDKFFDSLNVGNFTNGKYKRKVFQQPYRSGTDFRIKVRTYTCSYS